VNEKATALVIDDESQIRRLLRILLEQEHYRALESDSGRLGLSEIALRRPDVVLLDLGLPDIDGMAVLERLREWSRVPVLVLSVRDGPEDKVAALDAGADDYVTKPFAFEELLARVEALSRRPRVLAPPALKVADLELNLDTREVTRDGTAIDLTPKEYTVLEYLMRHAGRVMSRTLITEYAWDYHFDPGTNIVDVVINRLRKKVDTGHAQKLVHTVRGVGYVVKA